MFVAERVAWEEADDIGELLGATIVGRGYFERAPGAHVHALVIMTRDGRTRAVWWESGATPRHPGAFVVVDVTPGDRVEELELLIAEEPPEPPKGKKK